MYFVRIDPELISLLLCSRDMIAGHHVISIEEDGQITIRKLEEELEEEDEEEEEEVERAEVSSNFPPWYHRLASMLLGFLQTGTRYNALCLK